MEEARNGLEALELILTYPVDLVLLDIMLEGMDGIEVCVRLKADERTRLVPVVLVTALTELEERIKGIEAGADDFLSKPVSRLELLARVRSLVHLKRMNERLDSAESTILALARAVEAKDNYTEGHTERVAFYASSLGRRLNVSGPTLQVLEKAGIMHDVGKIGISDVILNKPGELNQEEWRVVKQHPAIGENICRPLRSLGQLLDVIRHHHERVDGQGYPDGLRGEEITLESRIVAIADAYDAMTTDRPYRKRLSREEAVRLLQEGAGVQWDKDLVREFIQLLAELGEY